MIDRTIVEKVARLARLELPEEQIQSLVHELGSILDHVEKLQELDVSGVPPLTHATGGTNVFREDEPGPTLDPGEALANAPDREGGFFRVPRVIEEA